MGSLTMSHWSFLFEKNNVITLHQIFAMMPPPLLVVIVVQVATFSLDHNKVLLELGIT
jgi:hypothetical protein